MVANSAADRTELIEKIVAQVNDRLPDDSAPLVAAFVRRYYAHVASEDLSELATDDLYGAALSHWNFALRRAPDDLGTQVRVYNPDLDQHGWQSTHSVVEIITPDKAFLVDSVVMELNRLGVRVHLVIHPIIRLKRDADGTPLALATAPETDGGAQNAAVLSFIHCEIDRQSGNAALEKIADALRRVLDEVAMSVADWPMMQQRMQEVGDELAASADKLPLDAGEIAEQVAFLDWLAKGHFIFLGFRDYELLGEGDDIQLRSIAGSGLGVLRDAGESTVSPSFTELPPALRRLASAPVPLIVSKSSARSRVHRPGHMDYIGVKHFDESGNVIGERRFLGLYTSAAYQLLPADIPLLRRKVEAVVQRSGLAPDGHAGKALANTLNTLPRDELFQIDTDELFEMAMDIVNLQERQRLRLFVRRDMFGRFVSCLVYVPRDRYDTNLRLRMQAVLNEAFNGTSSSFATQFSESILARVHFHIRTRPSEAIDYSVDELEQRLREAMLSWQDQLGHALTDAAGEAEGNALLQRYGRSLPPAYQADVGPRNAVGDIRRLESLGPDRPLAMRLYRSLENPRWLHFKVFGLGQPMALSDALPILERLGLRVVAAHPYEIALGGDGGQRWVLTFDMLEDEGAQVDVDSVKDSFREAFAQVWHGRMENDGFNRLVLTAGLDWREVSVLRAYCKYLVQTRVPFSQDYMQQTLSGHSAVTRQLIELFHVRFDPRAGGAGSDLDPDAPARVERGEALVASIESQLDQVVSLDDDRILRRFLAAILATLRCNFYQQSKDYLSFKFDPTKIPELPLPLPMFEIFVYSPRVEAVHLRGGPVARGGLRWSDRREDFRTEVLGLMKAQMVKNAVIVPVGSKGGFVVKRPPPAGDREALQQEVRACYTTFISGLLDLTDNRVGDAIEPPPQVVRYDSDDPYLVVAADKGTATFSDLANSVAIDYGFWLGDAFASGGANGYDHKKMGITARGAWESVKRHFRELAMDIQNRDDFTVVGIGDMGGDVFGNGMLLSRRIKLLAAFNHLHIFIDPDPDPEASYAERERLFALPRSSWADYDEKLLSPGGGVYQRSAKSITLSEQARAALAIDEHRLTPTELIHRLLLAPVDLLWNGGIGTYVKAASESHADVGDRANDALRVNGAELRCRVVGEGGNLGLTQLGRIEYAQRGGRVLTDAIDNSAGVNCSDHEVNIKILLNHVVAAGDMTEKQRNTLLAEMTDEVAELVLRQNYLQPEAISISHAQGSALLSDHARAMRLLERSGRLNRALEFLPDDEQIAERESAGTGLTPPELAVLLAYNKIMLFDALTASDVPEDPFLQRELHAYFPQAICQRYPAQMQTHPLRREIIATYLANSVLNRMGSAFLIRMLEDSNESAANIARAYSAAREIFRARELWQAIDALDNQVTSDVQVRMHWDSRRLLEHTSLWLLRNRRQPISIDVLVEQFAAGAEQLRAALPELLGPVEQQAFATHQQQLLDAGVPAPLAHDIISLTALTAAPDVIEIAQQKGRPIDAVASAYFAIAARLEFNWLRTSALALPAGNHWQRRARAALLHNLYDRARALTADALNGPIDTPAGKLLENWFGRNQIEVERVLSLLGDLRASGQAPDLAMLSVAVSATGNLIQETTQTASGLVIDNLKN